VDTLGIARDVADRRAFVDRRARRLGEPLQLPDVPVRIEDATLRLEDAALEFFRTNHRLDVRLRQQGIAVGHPQPLVDLHALFQALQLGAVVGDTQHAGMLVVGFQPVRLDQVLHIGDGAVHVLLRLRRALDAPAQDRHFRLQAEQRHVEAAVAARRAVADEAAFEHGHARRRVVRPDLARHGKAGEAAADDRHVDVDVAPQRLAGNRRRVVGLPERNGIRVCSRGERHSGLFIKCTRIIKYADGLLSIDKRPPRRPSRPAMPGTDPTMDVLR